MLIWYRGAWGTGSSTGSPIWRSTIYTRSVDREDPHVGLLRHRAVPGPGKTTAMGWEVYPEGLGELLVRLHRKYSVRALYVTENGVA
jgi:beta-glucosidase